MSVEETDWNTQIYNNILMYFHITETLLSYNFGKSLQLLKEWQYQFSERVRVRFSSAIIKNTQWPGFDLLPASTDGTGRHASKWEMIALLCLS